jgi:cysteine desulfurase/selenocysteine lyase
MLGPSGVGVLYAKRNLLENMPPFLGGGSMIHTVTEEGFTPGELPAKFEAGTPPIVPAIALKPAIEYLQAVGLEQVREHELQLTRRAHEVLAGIEGLRILGPAPELKGGIVSFVVAGVNVQDLATFMDLQGIAIRPGHHCAMPLHKRYGVPASSRASFYLYNTLEEVEAFGKSLRQVLNKLR